MPTEQQISEIVDEVRKRLVDAQQRGVHLEVTGEKFEDEWLYVVVAPTRAGERASEHARLMSEIERELRHEGRNNVLLVPALEE